MKNFLHIILVIVFLSLTSFATTATAQPETFSIDADHTHVSFTVKRFGFADTLAVFPTSSGTIMIDEDNPENSSVIAKVKTPDVWSGLKAREDAINGKGFLNTEKYPEITFVSSAVVLNAQDNKRANVTGDLTLLGQTRPVNFDVVLNRIGPDITKKKTKAIGFSMTAVIKRSDFGNTTAAKFIGDDVGIVIETIAHLNAEH